MTSTITTTTTGSALTMAEIIRPIVPVLMQELPNHCQPDEPSCCDTEHTTMNVTTSTHRVCNDSFLQTEHCFVCKPTQ